MRKAPETVTPLFEFRWALRLTSLGTSSVILMSYKRPWPRGITSITQMPCGGSHEEKLRQGVVGV